MKPLIYDYLPDELPEIVCVDLGEKPYRAKQLVSWLYPLGITHVDEMKNLPTSFRAALDASYSFSAGNVVETRVSPKGDAVKFVLELHDGVLIESVLLKAKKRRTLCVSSQVGCGLGCVFCETGKRGLVRNLSLGEILFQVIIAHRYLASAGERVSNIVFMGMGEALANFDNFEKVIGILCDDRFFGIGTRKITVSTAGLVPGIQKMIDRNISIELAISLNASSDEERSEIMPINKQYPIATLREAAEEYAYFRGRPVTFEYVLIAGKNDSDAAANRLIYLLKDLQCKLNLIPLNEGKNRSLQSPIEQSINRFAMLLYDGGILVTVRRSGGREIGGACGQLAGEVSSNEGADDASH